MGDDKEQIRRIRPLRGDGGAAELADQATASELRRVDFELREGEVLFVPFDTPHEVRNLTATVAVAANYWDQTNVATGVQQMEAKLSRLDPSGPRYANLDGLRIALDEIEWPSLDDD